MMAKYLAVAFVALVAMTVTPHAFATNPYYGGYAATAADKASQVFGNTSFQGSSAPSYYTGSVFSTSGVDSTGASTGITYQSPTTLNTNLSVTGDPQVWLWGATSPSWQSTSGSLGTIGSGSRNINNVYSTFYWNGARSQISFQYQPNYNDGTSNLYTVTYSKLTGDNSANFGAGYKDFSSGTYRVKLLQFGVESGDISTGWNIKQYAMGYVSTTNGVTNLSAINSYTGPWINTDNFNHSWIVYQQSGSSVSLRAVGFAQYNVNGDYHIVDSAVPAGTVTWFRGTFLTPGSQLW
jgi:hypothetical protein